MICLVHAGVKRGARRINMKAFTEYLTFNLRARMAFENITPRVERIVQQSGVQEGLCLVNTTHVVLHSKFRRWE